MARITCASAANLLVQLASMGCGVGLFLIVMQHLWVGGWSWDNVTSNFEPNSGASSTCMLAKPSVGVNLCAYSYAAVAVGWALAVLLLLAQFFKDSCCCAAWEYVLGAFGAVWWGAAALVATIFGVQANSADVPQTSWRIGAIWLAWAQVVLACISLGLTCCGGCGRGRKPRSADPIRVLPQATLRSDAGKGKAPSKAQSRVHAIYEKYGREHPSPAKSAKGVELV